MRALILLPLLLISLSGFSQKITASGEVKSETGEPILGLTVVEQGTTNGTVTDLDGKFVLEVPAGSKLQFSYIGYESQVLDAAANMKVTMIEDTKAIDEVVVVGYGVQRKEAVTGSVASMKGDDMRAVQGSNITQSLQGRIAGVEMSQVSSKPGETMQIRIRGTRSLNASNDPLIVLDGIPFAGSLSDINPSDIKTLDILKDASATAIYGSRGANGVIIITTNRGTEGQKAKISYNGYYGVKTLFSKYPMMNGEEFMKLRNDRGQFSNGVDESETASIDWQDKYFDKGMVTSHDVSMTGGTAKGSYAFGMGYYKEESVSPNEDFSRFSLRGSVDQKIGDYFKIGFSTNSNFSITNNCNKIFDILSASPVIKYDENDPAKIYTIGSSSGTILVPTRNYIESLGDKYKDERKNYGSYNTAYFEAELPYVSGLKYRINLGLNFRNQYNGGYNGVGIFSTNKDNPSNASQTHANTQNWAVENLITYDKIFAEKHSLNFVAMYSAESNTYTSFNVGVRDIQADHFQFYNLGQSDGTITINPAYQGYSKTGLESFMARAMYSYDSKYMISATIRSDASSRLAEGHKWHTYPAISLGWNVKNESFMESVDWMDQLKLRLGYGQTSNQAVDPYKTLGLLATQPYNFGDKMTTGYYVSELPNTELGWEFSSTINVGLDMAFFKNRLNVTAEYYAMTTKDVLLSVGLPSTAGVGSYMANIGETQNKGFELNIDGTILNKNGWNWTAGVNMYINRNKLTKLASGQEEDRGNSWFVGKPIDCIYDFEYDGLWQAGEEEIMNILEPGAKPGDIKVKYYGDYENGKPVRAINDDDKRPQSMEAKLQGGFNTTVTWKNIDLSVIGAFKCGGTLISTLYGSGSYLNLMTTKNNNVSVDYWTPTNTGARYPAPTALDGGDNRKYTSTLGYFNASYLKIRTITLGYSFDGLKALKNAGISKCRVYCSITNPLVMCSEYKKESGMDPETNSYGNENQAVASYAKRLLTIGTNTPATRTFMFGVNFTF